MSRNTGTFNFAANFEGLLKAPIDAKQLVGTYADLTTTATWNGSGSVWLYNGAMVVVGSDPTPANNGIYWLCDANNYTMTCAWKKAGSGSGGSGTLTGATNGLHLQYSGTSVALGGTLTGSTVIIDGRITKTGIEYGADYSGTFVPESLITKRYADAIVSGLKPKQAVKVATTAHIALSGLIIIDGITLTTGDRVLVKNQSGTTAAAANGIYSASTGTWGRTEDFDGTPIGEVVSGSYTWVLSGNTNQNTSWVLVTPDPIIVGVTPMSFAYFNHIQDITSGTGITVTMNGGNSVISINSAYQSEIHSSLTGSTGSGVGISGRNVCLNSSTIAILNSAITGATNGLCKYDGHDVCLGGKLYSYTTIDLNGNFLTICGAPGHAFIELNDPSTSACFGTNISGAVTELRSGCYDLTIGNASGSAYFQDFDSITPRGIQYNSDYSCTFCNNSLITKKYVDTAILASGATSISAGNGLTKQGNTIILGGTITGATTINTGVNDFNICGVDGNLSICQGAGITLSGTTVSLIYDGIHKLVVNGSGTGFDGPVLFACTATYFQDESGTYSCLSIPNVGWVTGQTSTSGIQTANNGLSKNGSNVVLGGTLTGTTAIIQAGNTFSICTTSAGSTPRFIMNPSSTSTELGIYCNSTCNTKIYSSGAGLPTTGIYSIGGTSCSSIVSDVRLSLNSCNGTCGTTVCLSENGLCYAADYSSRWNTCRYIPDINFVTGCTVNLITCYSNIDSIRNITTSTTTTKTDNFVGVDITLGSRCVYLYPTPKAGQKVTIVDVIGDALSNPITIDGNGNMINGCQCASINTEYGSITFIFNCSNFWSAVAFVN